MTCLILGASIALLDSIYLPLHLPEGISFTTIIYVLPRVGYHVFYFNSDRRSLLYLKQVGDQAFADYIDVNLRLTHINNREDPFPIHPSMSSGYVHPSGEVHIQDSGGVGEVPGTGQPEPAVYCG